MRRAVLLLVAAALLAPSVAAADKTTGQHGDDLDDDSDSAPFMIVVEHGDGWRCSGSLVSLRTALTSAWCVRGASGQEPRELWAVAPGAPPASRRVARVALAAGGGGDAPAWGGAALDIAVLELEAPFGGGARSRPILMATAAEDCAAGAMCHVVRALGRASRLRIVDALLVPGAECGRRARGWPGLGSSALCLAGPTLCSRDRGAGVVCDGKLCGVLSRSARGEAAAPSNSTPSVEEAADESCGDVHVAQSVARWRRFLHCAHTLRACGSGGECAQLCSERQLMVMEADDAAGTGTNSGSGTGLGLASGSGPGSGPQLDTGTPSNVEPDTDLVPPPPPPTLAPLPPPRPPPPPPTTTSPAPPSPPPPPHPTRAYQKHYSYRTVTLTSRLQYSMTTSAAWRAVPAVTRDMPTRSSPDARLQALFTSEPAGGAPASSSRQSFEFEPNRPDFKGGPARRSRVYLKAGEYGDNVAAYSDEGAPGPAAAPPAAAGVEPPPSPPPLPPRPTHSPALEAQHSANVTKMRTQADAYNCAHRPRRLYYVFVAIIMCFAN